MTKTELRYHVFKAGDKAKYKGKIYKIASVDFQEYLLGLRMNISGDDPNDKIWVRCENVYFMDETDQKAREKKTLSFNDETGIYEVTCRLRINTHRSGPGRLQQMYINQSTGKAYWKDVEIGNFQD